MGQKVHPQGFRLGIVARHSSVWYAKRNEYRENLLTDLRVREYLEEKLAHAQISEIIIERKPRTNSQIRILTARPGAVIGKKGEEIEMIRKELCKPHLMGDCELALDIEEIKKPDLDARLVASSVARQLERRVMFRRALKKAAQNAIRQGAAGIRVQVSGRLGGADIARTEWIREGRVPLHTLRADIDYASERASTTYGVIGVKVWVFRGEVIETEEERQTG